MINAYNPNIFISHSWSYSDHYDKLAEWIFEDSWNLNGVPIHFTDLSVPKEDPIHYANNERELRAAIYSRIYNSNVVVIPTGMYATHSNWIGKEIDGANAYSKPILAVDPWGQERKSQTVTENATSTVGWNKQSVINEIWRLYQR